MAEASVFALGEELIVAENPKASSFVVEILADDQTFIPFQEVKAVAASRQILTQAPILIPVQDYFVEVLADDQSFVFPDDLKSVAAARQLLVQPPFARTVGSYVVEVLAEVELEPMPQVKMFSLGEEIIVAEIPTPIVQNYTVEILAGASLDQDVSSYVVEVLGDDTTPNSIANFIVEVLADSTDNPTLTSQTITWFFTEH